MSDNKATNNFEVYSTTIRTEMVPFIPQSAATILDVGCSVGNFGDLIKSQRKVEYWGVEVDQQAAGLASQKLDKVVCAPFEHNLDLPQKYFDCIVFNDVLEHMVDPYTALEYAKQLLKDEGRIVASIPNVRYFGNMWSLTVHKDWNYTDTGILDRTHLRFFTAKSIALMFRNLGYHVEVLEGINPVEQCEPWFTKKFKYLNLITLNKLEDMRWLQFAVVASILPK